MNTLSTQIKAEDRVVSELIAWTRATDLARQLLHQGSRTRVIAGLPLKTKIVVKSEKNNSRLM